MPGLTEKETGMLADLIAMEASMEAKLRFYAETSEEDHIQKLCGQLADRSHQHAAAIAELIGRSESQLQ